MQQQPGCFSRERHSDATHCRSCSYNAHKNSNRPAKKKVIMVKTGELPFSPSLSLSLCLFFLFLLPICVAMNNKYPTNLPRPTLLLCCYYRPQKFQSYQLDFSLLHPHNWVLMWCLSLLFLKRLPTYFNERHEQLGIDSHRGHSQSL
jgi:hypothetical protein